MAETSMGSRWRRDERDWLFANGTDHSHGTGRDNGFFQNFYAPNAAPRSWRVRLGRFLFIGSTIAGLAFFVLDRLFPFPLETLPRPLTNIAASADADQRLGAPLTTGEVPPKLSRAVIALEDRWFGWHPGVNPAAIIRATWTNWRSGRVVAGGATIPMQIARFADPQARTVWTKCREAFRALQLQQHFSSAELMAVYLNLRRYGTNVEGVGAAAYTYFGKRPTQLSLGDVALLSTPPRAFARYDAAQGIEQELVMRNRVLDELEDRGVFSQRAITAARRQPLPLIRTTLRPANSRNQLQ